MTFEAIVRNISKHIALTAQETELFTSRLSERQVKRKEFLLVDNTSCPSIFYVVNGALRAFYRDKDGNDSMIMFALSDWWVTDMYAFASGNKSMLHIDALEDSTVFELRKSDLDQLFIDVPKLERFFRILMQNAYIREQVRIIQNLSMPAEERYQLFLSKYPQFAERIPLKQVASYLGITPEFLSVLRRRAAGK